ncbi:FAD-dependent oxidoreductase [Patescibacteria group bacterium AH-259-L07]|nr:FAD-dependent oxidoreductase [Patescibacteria group bacterium AH-259-L07]
MLDLLIIGASAAGASAGIYAVRRKLNFKIITYDTGGEVATSGIVDNFPGWGHTDGVRVSEKFQEHLKLYNVIPETGIKVGHIRRLPDGSFEAMVDKNGNKMKYQAKTVLIATGVHPRELQIPGEKEYKNKGLSYCSVCDAPLFAGKVTATVGGGDSAKESALMLNDIAKKAYVINKNPDFIGDKTLTDKVKKADNVEIIYNALTTEIFGNDFVKGLKYKDKEGKEHTLEVGGVFIHIGMIPNSDFVPDDVKKDDYGAIIVNKLSRTNVPGFFAAGDITDIPFKQIAIASGQGVCAVLSAVDYLNKLN